MLQYLLYAGLATTRLHAAFYAIIPDCDEVYNYWEPLNFLTRFFGKQTWEYSPEFAIRSYVYLCQFSVLIYPLKLVQMLFKDYSFPSYTFFYMIRIIMALLFTISEIKLSKSLKFLNKSIQNWFLLAQILSPGMYQAAISILPSSYALLLGILSTNFIIHYFNTEKLITSIDSELLNLEIKSTQLKETDDPDTLAPRTNTLLNLHRISIPLINKYYTLAILTVAIPGFLAWPFTMILIFPFLSYIFYKTMFTSPKSILRNDYNGFKALSVYILAGLSCSFFIPFFITQFDSLFYKKSTFVSINIISYNVFNSSEFTGPQIFGIESWDWYFKNLLLNFHLFFIIACLNLFTLTNKYQLIIYKIPLLLWITIFISQPHKEERFMYPIYHLLSISFAQFMSCETFKRNSILKFFKKAFNITVIVSTIFLFLTRINNLNNNYSAPIEIFKFLNTQTSTTESKTSPLIENICIGREWYHYPSSFFLNDNQRLKFTKSSFNGMLPGDFVEPQSPTFENLSLSTSFQSHQFNNKNEFNPAFVISDINECNYFIDIDKAASHEDQASLNDFEILYCADIIDVDNSFGVERVLNIRNFVDTYIRKPWLNLQEDLTTIELQRKLMEMSGIIADGRSMYDNVYIRLHQIDDYLLQTFPHIIGEINYNKFCVSRRY
ncbi:hypothetical protein CANINC_002285 [Pichia inconspicua]|uniref:Mannosyltransferase n=1 Tax=Pichia inconspicua TaxID=52247 RepID=A0A4T0X1X1_9ASCO|nr:hypothetical protein CANINC_002285 [[Candida] inconspicua]